MCFYLLAPLCTTASLVSAGFLKMLHAPRICCLEGVGRNKVPSRCYRCCSRYHLTVWPQSLLQRAAITSLCLPKNLPSQCKPLLDSTADCQRIGTDIPVPPAPRCPLESSAEGTSHCSLSGEPDTRHSS